MEVGRLVPMLMLVTMVPGILSRSLQQEWGDYKARYNKTYMDESDEAYRQAVWKENLVQIEKHNLEANLGLHSYWLKINHLGDMRTDEINLIMNNLQPGLSVNDPDDHVNNGQIGDRFSSEMSRDDYVGHRLSDNETAYIVGSVPDSVDWRKRGYVTPVKYQGHCGGCYAFSATGALEGQHFRKTGRLVSLSEQNLVDCTYDQKYHDHGCHGGLMDHAFRYVIDNGGVDTESSYPYTATVGTCRFKPSTVGAKARSYRDVLPRGDENKLKEAVGRLGPVSIGIDAHSFGFHFYSSGVYDSWFCSAHKLNHAVLAVGYGTTHSGVHFWIVKNSWGSWWGEDGYVKMSRNKDNQCGIASLGSYPIV